MEGTRVKAVLGHSPKRKTKDFNQWTGYVHNQLQKIRGLNPHDKPLR